MLLVAHLAVLTSVAHAACVRAPESVSQTDSSSLDKASDGYCQVDLGEMSSASGLADAKAAVATSESYVLIQPKSQISDNLRHSLLRLSLPLGVTKLSEPYAYQLISSLGRSTRKQSAEGYRSTGPRLQRQI